MVPVAPWPLPLLGPGAAVPRAAHDRVRKSSAGSVIGCAGQPGGRMRKEVAVVHHTDRRRDVVMPYAPGIVVRRGQLVFLSGVTAAPVYHHHPHREEDFDLPVTMREQAVLVMENLKKTVEAAGCTLADVVSATRYLTNVHEQDDLNRVWAQYMGVHMPTTTTVEVSRLATHERCKVEISAIAVTAGTRAARRTVVRAERRRGAGRASGKPGGRR